MNKLEKFLGFFTALLLGVVTGLIILSIVLILYKSFANVPIGVRSKGEMTGQVVKLSYKGYIWKTYDGYILLGSITKGVADRWNFTIKDNNKTIMECLSSNKIVKIKYIDYIANPYKLGYNHQVVDCKPVKDN